MARNGVSQLHKILVIYAADFDAANTFCNEIGAEGNTFSIALYDQNKVLSGYWCGWNMTEEQFEAIEGNTMFQMFNTPQEALQATGWHVSTGNEGE